MDGYAPGKGHRLRGLRMGLKGMAMEHRTVETEEPASCSGNTPLHRNTLTLRYRNTFSSTHRDCGQNTSS